jgi:hypothetical protein
MLFRRLLGLSLLAFLLAACTLTTYTQDGLPENLDVGTLSDPFTPDPSPQPGLIERSLSMGSQEPPYSINIVYPYFEGEHAQTAPFNAEVDRIVENATESFVEAVIEREDENGERPMSTLTIAYELTHADDRLVSVYLAFDTYIAISAHPFPASQSLNYDITSGRFLSLGDLFLSEVDPLRIILEVVEPELLSRNLGFTAGVAETVLRSRENWNLFSDGLQINFDVYEVGPYAAGPQHVHIPWEVLSTHLDSHGPASFFLED